MNMLEYTFHTHFWMGREVKLHEPSNNDPSLILLYPEAISHTCKRRMKKQDGMDCWRAQNLFLFLLFIGTAVVIIPRRSKGNTSLLYFLTDHVEAIQNQVRSHTLTTISFQSQYEIQPKYGIISSSSANTFKNFVRPLCNTGWEHLSLSMCTVCCILTFFLNVIPLTLR